MIAIYMPATGVPLSPARSSQFLAGYVCQKKKKKRDLTCCKITLGRTITDNVNSSIVKFLYVAFKLSFVRNCRDCNSMSSML